MLKVKVDELRRGDITAEHILSEDGAILLAANSTLTVKAIELLKTWNIGEIRIREDKDTDEDVKLALQFDEITRQHSQLFQEKDEDEEALPLETTAPTTAEPQPELPLPSAINEKSLAQYDEISRKFQEIMLDKEQRCNQIKLETIANIVCKYVLNTPAAIGYTLKAIPVQPDNSHIARHNLSVAVIATKLARLMRYPREDLPVIALGGLVHDIGKFVLPPEAALPKAKRTEAGERLYRSHVQAGYEMLKHQGFPREITYMVLQHHECEDGSGFPLQLKAPKIHPYAQVLALADRFDALIHENSTLPNLFDIRPRLLRSAVGQISADIIDIFDRYLEEFVFSVNVELSDGRQATVIYSHPSFMSPVVKTSDGEYIDLNRHKDLHIVNLAL